MMKALVRRVVGVSSCLALVLGVIVGLEQPAMAQTASPVSVSITPVDTTTSSGVATTYTLEVGCSVTGGCTNTTVSFPTTTITGNGSNTDFGSWFGNNSCPGVTKTVSGGMVTFNYGTIPTGAKSCTFTVTPPEGTTLDGAQITLTPTMSGTNFTSVTGNSAVLTVDLGASGGHNAFIGKTGTAVLASGGALSYTVTFTSDGPPGQNLPCGGARGSLNVTSVSIQDVLPPNFVFETLSETLPGEVVYDAGTRTVTYSSPGGINPCGTITLSGKAADNLASNTLICNTASATVTYVDGFQNTITSNNACARITSTKVPDNFLTKGVYSYSMQNRGQYVWSKNNVAYPYVYPGQPSADPGGTYWDNTAYDMYWELNLLTSTANAGVEFDVTDPMPCMDNFDPAVRTYDSRATGTGLCQNPAFIPRLITASGFTPTTADVITLVHPDGSTSTVAYNAAAGGWAIPASPVVSEIRIPRFASTASNTSSPRFRVHGHAASAAQSDVRMGNTATADAYEVGSTEKLVPTDTGTGYALIASPDPGTSLWPIVRGAYQGAGTCRQNVLFNGTNIGPYQNAIQIAKAPSEAIYVDYLAPAGSTILTGTTNTFRFTKVVSNPFGTSTGQGASGGTFNSVEITATVTPDWNGTGRPLVSWIIPAGTVTTPGYYQFVPLTTVTVDLGSGCAGLYENDLTVGYGAPVVACLAGTVPNPSWTPPPRNPAADLFFNSTPLAGNYCGTSSNINVVAINPAYSVNKTVQGNLDGQPLSAGETGHVSPSGGTATYNVTFTNTGQSNLTDPVMYDILPAVGDTQATTLTQRGSEFGVSLTGVGPLPAGVSVSYSTSANPCRPEVLPTNPGCDPNWLTAAPADLSTVRALKFVYTGTVGLGASFNIPFTVSTPSATPGQTAWNTVGVAVMAGTTNLTPAESSPTGLQSGSTSGANRVSKAAVVAASVNWSLGDALPGSTTIDFAYGAKPLSPLMGDWNGDGLKTVGTFELGTFKLNNQNDSSDPDVMFAFGDPRGYPVAGDFDGNGVDDVAVYRAGNWQIHYLGAGAPADASFSLGAPFATGTYPNTIPVAGDWNGDGIDGIGTYNLANGQWVLKNTVGSGGADVGPIVFWGGSGSYPIVGDWDGDGTDTPGYRIGSVWTTRNGLLSGETSTFTFGVPNSVPFTW